MPIPLINVSNRLPVTIKPEGITKSSGGLVTALEGLSKDDYSLTWIGWPGNEVAPGEQEKIAAELAKTHGCTPVFVPQPLADDHYEGFSNSSIWPLLHYLPSYLRYEKKWWNAYQQVNQLFADKILSIAKDDQLVWVHDYQLMLLPRLLKQARPNLKIGFFLHTPFPSSEVFRCHPNREALLDGVLGSDLCGFHTFGYLREFRSSVVHLLGATSEITTIRHQGEMTRLGVFPIGIPAQRFADELKKPAFKQQLQKLTDENRGRKVILSVERLDYTKGILPRLDSIDLYLARLSPEERDGVKFIFVSIPTRGGVDAYRDLRQKVETRVGAINGKFTTLHNSPVHFIHGSVNFSDLCALYALADVALVTPLRDGLNLVAKEFIACQQDYSTDSETPGATHGVLVLSEFAGAAEELFSAILVNPNDTAGVADAIAGALTMPADERRRRMEPLRKRVATYDAAAWAADFVGELGRPVPPASASEALSTREQLENAEALLGAAFSEHRAVAMFLDFDGTLRELVKDPSLASPQAEVTDLLDRLHQIDALDLSIISGRTTSDLQAFLGGYSRFTLIAEHGAAIRQPGSTKWERLDENLSYDWKQEMLKVLRLFERSTPGTHIEDKRTGLVWHYRRADAEFGEWKARELVQDLSALAANDTIEIRHGRRIVEIVSTHVNKAAALMRVLQRKRYDLIFIAGDDTTDESMFALELRDYNVITVRVGSGETRAKFRVANPAALRGMIKLAAGG